ncbi:hypothetical protein YN1_2360 [Nanoarchaeota archaeon]
MRRISIFLLVLVSIFLSYKIFSQSIYQITITNSQPIPTPAPFQQDIAICNGNVNLGNNFAYVDNSTLFNEIDSNGQNVYFFTNINDPTGSLLYSWYEGQENFNRTYCDVWWVKLPNGIPANSNYTIYMHIGNSSNNYYSQYYPYVGAPIQVLSTSQYDNGNYVFNYYQNFGGLSSLPSGWSIIYCSVSPNFGTDYTILPSNGCNSGITTTNNYSIQNNIIEAELSIPVTSGTTFDVIVFGIGNASTTYTYFIGGGGGLTVGGNNDGAAFSYNNNGNAGLFELYSGNTTIGSTYYNNITTIYGIGLNSTTIDFYINYTTVGSSTILPSNTTLPITIAQQASLQNYLVYWVRIRSYPPNGVMPSFSIQPAVLITSITLNPSSGSSAPGGSLSTTATANLYNPGGASTTVTFSCNTPSGFTCSFPQGNSCTTTSTSCSIPINITSSTSVSPGSYNIQIVGSTSASSASATFTYNIPSETISVSASPSTLNIYPGSSNTSTITASDNYGYSLSLSCSNLPSGWSCSFNPSTISSGSSSTLTISVPSSTSPGTYNINIVATDTVTGNSNSTTITVTVPSESISVSASPSSLTIYQGSYNISTITASDNYGYSLSLSCNAPSGLSCSISPNTTSSGGSAVLNISVSPTTNVGTYTVTITATDTVTGNSGSINITVNVIPPTITSLILNPSSGYTYPGGSLSTTATANLYNPGGASTTITLSCNLNNIYQITITNSQPIPTPAPFQQDIAICNGNVNLGNNFAYVDNPTLFNEIDSNGQNVYFSNSTTLLYSWFEGQENINGVYCDVWWVKLPNGIPANGQVTIYMNVGPSSTNYYQQYYPFVGVSAYWYCYEEGYTNMSQCLNYGIYDNGQYVFEFYDNFAGTSLNTDLWVAGEYIPSGSTGYMNVDNGVQLYYLGNGSYGGVWIYSKQTFTQSQPFIWETLENLYGSSGDDIRAREYIWLSSATSVSDIADQNYYSWMVQTGHGDYGLFSSTNYYNQAEVFFNGAYNGYVVPASSSVYDYTFIVQEILNSTGFAFNILWPDGVVQNSNYVTGSSSDTFVLLFQASTDGVSGVSTEINIGWTLVRAYPPNGVMPSISIQQISSPPSGVYCSLPQGNSCTTTSTSCSIPIDITSSTYTPSGTYSIQVIAFNNYSSYIATYTLNILLLSEILKLQIYAIPENNNQRIYPVGNTLNFYLNIPYYYLILNLTDTSNNITINNLSISLQQLGNIPEILYNNMPLYKVENINIPTLQPGQSYIVQLATFPFYVGSSILYLGFDLDNDNVLNYQYNLVVNYFSSPTSLVASENILYPLLVGIIAIALILI